MADEVFDNEGSSGLGGSGPIPLRPRAGDGDGEGTNGSTAFVVEGSIWVIGCEPELDIEVVELEDEVDVDNTGGGMMGAVFGGGVGPGCDGDLLWDWG